MLRRTSVSPLLILALQPMPRGQYYRGGRHFQRPDKPINLYVWAPAGQQNSAEVDALPNAQLSCPLPLAFYSMYGMRIDRLLMRQQLELKVASNIGQRFKVRVLEEVLLKENLKVTCKTLMADLKSMEMQGVIRETRTTFGDMASMDPQAMDAHRKRAAQSAEFAFCDPCMREVVLRRMLKESQREQLHKKIVRYDNKFQDTLRKEILLRLPTLTSNSIEVPQLEQFCRVQKNSRGTNKVLNFLRSDWKRRLVKLSAHGDEIVIYRDQDGKNLAQRASLAGARINNGAAGTNLTAGGAGGGGAPFSNIGGLSAHLAGLVAGTPARANARPGSCLSIHVQTWFQQDEEEASQEGPRDFNIELNSSQDLQQWTYWIQFCIDRLDVAAERRKQVKDTAMKAASVPRLAHLAIAAKKNAVLMNSEELQSTPVAQQWNEAWRHTDPNKSPRNCIRLLLGNVELLPAVWGGDVDAEPGDVGAVVGKAYPYRRRYARHANSRPMLYCVVQHGGQEWSSRIVDQAHLPIWEEGVCMELKARPDQYTYGPGGDFGLAPTELRVCVYAYSEFASGQLLASVSMDLRTAAQRFPSRDAKGQVILPDSIASWCSVAESEKNPAFHILPMQTVADAPATASAVAPSDEAAAASAFTSRRVLNLQTDSLSSTTSAGASKENAEPTAFLKCCLWLNISDQDVATTFAPPLPPRSEKLTASPVRRRAALGSDLPRHGQSVRQPATMNTALSVDTGISSKSSTSLSMASPTLQSDILSTKFSSARALLEWQIQKIREGGAWSLDALERVLNDTFTEGGGVSSTRSMGSSAQSTQNSGHKRADSLTSGLLERSASILEFEAQRESAKKRIQERRKLRTYNSAPVLSPTREESSPRPGIASKMSFGAVDVEEVESDGEDFPAVVDSDQSLEASPDRASGARHSPVSSPIDFPGTVSDEDQLENSAVDAAGIPFVGSVAEGDPDDLAARRRSSVAAARAAVESVPVHVKESLFVYTDADGRRQGPFTAAQICEWYHMKLIDGRVRLMPHEPHSSRSPLKSASAVADVPFSPMHRPGVLYVADVVGDLYLRERVAWGSQALLMPEVPSRAVGNMLAWDFDAFLLDNDERVSLIASALALLGFVEKFNIPPRKLCAFATKVAQVMGAHRLPYHNFVHAVDCFQTLLVMLVHPKQLRGEMSGHPHGDSNVSSDIVAQCAVQCMGAEAFFEPIDLLALLIAALLHDLDHPGLNNAYQVAAGTELAQRYHDQSVLENHHIAIALSILSSEAFSIFEGLSSSQFDHVRKILIETILATDMARHSDVTTQFAKFVERVPDQLLVMDSFTPVSQKLSNSQKLCVMRTLVHAADISNPTKQWAVASRWSEAIVEEFYAQGEKEAENGLPISPGFDRRKHLPGKGALSFADFVVIPLFEDLKRILPMASQCLVNVRANRVKWKEEMKAFVRSKGKKKKGAASTQHSRRSDESAAATSQRQPIESVTKTQDTFSQREAKVNNCESIAASDSPEAPAPAPAPAPARAPAPAPSPAPESVAAPAPASAPAPESVAAPAPASASGKPAKKKLVRRKKKKKDDLSWMKKRDDD